MITLFYNKSGITAKALVDNLNKVTEARRVKVRPGARPIINPDHTNVSYGASIQETDVPVYNSMLPRIGKLTCLQRLNDHGLGVPIARNIVFPDLELEGGNNEEWESWLWRTEHGSKGRDIIFQRRGEPRPAQVNGENTRYTFASQFIEKVAEFRAHVFGGEVLQVTRKKPADPTVVAWNTGQDVVQHRIKNRLQIETIGNVAVDAITAMPGTDIECHFGAVDIIMDRWGTLYVLEINSAPGLTVESRLNAYTNKILELAGVDERIQDEEEEV